MKKLTFLVLLFSFFISTQAQVTITQSNVESLLTVGTTITTYVDTISTSFDIGSTGQSSWDFSGHPYQTVIDIVNIDPSTSPVANRFTAGNYATYSTVDVGGVVSESWAHVSVQNNIYSDIGTHSIVYEGGEEGIKTITTEFNPPEIIYQFPLTYGSNWSQSGTRDFEIEIFGFKQGFSVDYSVTRTIDAYGTLTMPDGTTIDVLRVKN
ncbi:MAG TPA: hypothetical protein ENN33_06010 [Ignavibacteria bacterium]|nr:hypothetical protein [Ignavibacteria bacterium]